MPVLGDETGGLGVGAVLILHDEATLLPVAQQDGKLRLGAMNDFGNRFQPKPLFMSSKMRSLPPRRL